MYINNKDAKYVLSIKDEIRFSVVDKVKELCEKFGFMSFQFLVHYSLTLHTHNHWVASTIH